MGYWFNVITKEVVADEDRGPAADLLGPYETREEAANALALAKARTEAEDAADRAWNGDDQDDAAGGSSSSSW